MPDKEDLRRIALSIPGIVEEGEYSFKANGIGVAWPWLERTDPKKARVPNYAHFGIRVSGEDHKLALVASEPDKYFTEPHYNGYPAVLVHLGAVDDDELRDLLSDARDLAMAKKQRRSRRSSS